MSKHRIYLDYAATTPTDPRVVKAMEPFFTTEFGNPGSLHQFGQRASAAVFKARQSIAKVLGAHYSEIIFTASATEANNLAFGGVMRRFVRERIKNKEKHVMPRLIISAIEHESVLNTAKDLARDGADVVIIPVSKEGVVDLKKLKASLNEHTALVSIMYANNETGVVQPISKIAEIIREFRGSKQWPLLHTDASQALQYLDCNIEKLGVDLLTISSQKIYGPKGVGALYVRSKKLTTKREYPLDPILTGGGQEQGLRSSTENVPGIVGFAKAVELVEEVKEKEFDRVSKLQDHLWRGIKKIFPKADLNGPQNILSFSRMIECRRLPNNVNVYIPGISGEQLLVALDLKGIAVSSGSACTARSIDPSHVLLAMKHSKERAKNSIRITLGRPTVKKDIDVFLVELLKYKNIYEPTHQKRA